ncbi:MAG: glycosyltransferase, partial [Williamsia herbipolensis]|nr:glycosyltransferase [Williamsia herbipolensis]
MTEAQKTILVAHPGAELYGSDRVLLESVSALVDGGWRTVVAVPERGPLLAAVLERGAEVVVAPTAVVRKSVLSPRGLVGFASDVLRGLPSALRILRRTGATAVYVNTVTVPLWLLAARLRRIPAVTHVHEGESSAPAILRRAMTAPLLLSTRIIANSRFSIGVLERSIRSVGRRTVLVHNGVAAPDRVVPARSPLVGLRVCYVGRLSPRKGVDVAVDAVA